jgi:tetratricopeptide (TPR) repeat protein
MSIMKSTTLAVALFLLTYVAGLHAGEDKRQQERLTVAVLAFKDKTGDSQAAHWRHTLLGLIKEQIKEVKTLRLIWDASEFGFRHLNLKPEQAPDPDHARRIGELIEARRVVWGSYQRHEGKWLVSARVLNVASGQVSSELTAEAADWFDVRDSITDQILKELQVAPSEPERKKMQERWTASALALELDSQARALHKEEKPMPEVVAACRKTIAADPQFGLAHLHLTRALGSQGQFAAAEESAHEALRLSPDSALAHEDMGWLLGQQEKNAEAENEYRTALRLDPDAPFAWHGWGEFRFAQGNEEGAIAAWQESLRLDFTSAEVHGHLALAYAHRQEREKAMAELKQAERFNPDNDFTEVLIAQAYGVLGEIPPAVKHLENSSPGRAGGTFTRTGSIKRNSSRWK